MTSGQTSLEQMLGVYKWVVDDVMKNVREDFLNEGADTQVLEDLKQLWENKLVQSGALSRPTKALEPHPSSKDAESTKHHHSSGKHHQHQSSAPSTSSSPIASVIQQAPPRPSASSMTTPTTSTPLLTLPPPPLIEAQTQSNTTQQSQSESTGATASSSSLPPQQNQGGGLVGATLAQQQAALYQSLSSAITAGASPVAGNTLPVMIPSGLTSGVSLINHGGIPYAAVPTANGITYVPIALNLPPSTGTQSSQDITQSDGPLPLQQATPTVACRRKPPKRIPQLDGPPDGSSSEESDDSSDSDPDDLEEEQPEDEEPLNSNDDAESDEEDDVWDTENTIVCQFEKVYRVRSKWKFALKDGIMHLKGHDYIFTKTTGEAEW